MLDSDRVPAALDSHTPHHHNAVHPLPIPSNFESHNADLSTQQKEVIAATSTTPLDGRLLATDVSLLQELRVRNNSTTSLPPAKRLGRAALPPQLTLAIPHHQSDARTEWTLPVHSAGFGEGAATQIHAEHSGVGAGYFSPPRSPDAPHFHSQSPPLPKPGSIATSELSRISNKAKSRTGAPKMVKERRSLQTLLIPSFLSSLQVPSTPIGLIPGPRVAALPSPVPASVSSNPSMTSTNSNSSPGAEASNGNGSGSDGKGERRRSFYGRRRSQTYAGAGSSAASIASTSTSSIASTSTLVPPMPTSTSTPMSDSYPPLDPAHGAPGGRESPSAYLLDDDPFAFAPAPLSPPSAHGQSNGQSSAYGSLYSPVQSLRSPSMASLSSASTGSMPGTPTILPFSALPDEREREREREGTATSSVSEPALPPPTPASPLNPNPPSFNFAHDAQKPHMHSFRSLSATTSLPTLAHPHTTSPLSPSSISSSSSIPQLPHQHPPSVRARPAHTRPAFAPRPSLPSLSTLSRMSAAATGGSGSGSGFGTGLGMGLGNPFSFRRKRKGKVGAGLPAEPWDLVADEGEGEEGLDEGENENDVEDSFGSEPSSSCLLETEPATQSNVDEAEASRTASPTSVQFELVEGERIPSMLAPANVRLSEGNMESASAIAYLCAPEDRTQVDGVQEREDESVNMEEVRDECGDSGADVVDSGADVVEVVLTDADTGGDGEREAEAEAEADGKVVVAESDATFLSYEPEPAPASETVDFVDVNGDMDKADKADDVDVSPEVCDDDQETDLLDGDCSLELGDDDADENDVEDKARLPASITLPSSSTTNGSPIRASAIPRHVLRALTPYPFGSRISGGSSGFSSPASSHASLSPMSSVEDFGILLSVSASPGYVGEQRPESLTIDPALPDARAVECDRVRGEVREEGGGDRNSYMKKDGPTSLFSSLGSAILSSGLPMEPLPSADADEGDRGDPEAEAESETGADADADLRSASDAVQHKLELGIETYATLVDLSLSGSVSSISTNANANANANSPLCDSPISTRDLDDRGCSPFDSPVCEGQQDLESGEFAPEGDSLEDYTEYYLNLQHEHERSFDSVEEEDSSMLPPLSTLPEDDPVFSLSPARSVSRKSSFATIATIFSGRSGSSGRASQNSHSRGHSPAVSLSLSYSNSNSNSGSVSGSYGRRLFGSSGSGSADFSRGGIAPSSSMTSLRSQSSADLRGLARVRRQGSESSGISLMSRSSTRTKYEPHVPVKTSVSPSVEELSLGLRAYEGNPYAEAELERYGGLVGKPRYGDEELGIDMRRADTDVAEVSRGDAQLTGWRPFDSQAEKFEPGSSAGTLRPVRSQVQMERGVSGVRGDVEWGTAAMHARSHTNGYSGGRGGAGKEWAGTSGYGDAYGRRNGSSGSDYERQRDAMGGGRRGRGSGRDEDDEGRRRRKPDVVSPPISTSESETDSESDSGTDDYGEESPGVARRSAAPSVPALRAPARTQEGATSPVFNQLRNGRKGVYRPPADSATDNARSPSRPETAEDDDVPLAQRIPGALKAQKSIRQQVRSERDQKRRERSVAPTPRTSRAPEGSTSPVTQYLPVQSQLERGRSLATRQPKTAVGASTFSSSQEAAMMAARTLQPQAHHVQPVHRRARAKTLSDTGVPAEDLAKRLLKVAAREGEVASSNMQRTSAASPPQAYAPGTSYTREMGPMDRTQPMSATSRRSPHSPQFGAQPFHMQHNIAEASVPVRTLRPMRSFHGSSPVAVAPEAAAPPIPSSLGRRPTLSKVRQPQDANEELLRSKSVKTPRTSMDKNARTSHEEAQVLLSHHHHAQAPPVPPVPDLSRGSSPPAPSARHAVVQTRVYISDMQHFNVVEASVETSARDVLDMLRQQGDLRGEERRSSSWMLYEVCHDFGMERPVRSFELVTDISGSWNKEKTMNCFMVKQSPYANSLANIPSSIPTRSGYVDYESKKGRWNKRWLELREHGLWLSKREGKDDEFLCSLSAFDAYVVTRIQKSSKSFSFAVKSTDPITLFENKADYLHVFSVPEDTGMAWVESILLARSYILYQEKNVLFRNKNTAEGTGLGSSAGTGLARSGTRKKPAQTYVTIPPPGAFQQSGPFEPGSLLAKRSAS